MKFSIIIPLFNKAPFVEKALLSIQAQTFREFEVIVIDDGSTDNSLEEVQKFKNSKIQIVSQKNAGVSTARNNGVKLAKYPYICFLDADDWWAPTFLEEMKQLIDEFPDAGIYGTNYYIVKNDKHRVARIGVEDGFDKGEINYYQVYSKTLIMPLTSISIAIPKSVFESENGFNPSLKLGEDFDLWIRIALKHPVVLLNKPLAYYNQDVDIQNRAVGNKFYKPEEHMLFTDYGVLMNNPDFKLLFERLALYGLLPYYVNQINNDEVINIISSIADWGEHDKKYFIYYRMPYRVLVFYMYIHNLLYQFKNKLKSYHIVKIKK